MTALPDRWAVVSLWTFEDNITSWDYDAVESTHPTREEAREALALLKKDRLYEVDAEESDSPSWCIGLGIAPEPAEGHAPDTSSYSEEIEWAEHVPHDFPEQEALE